MRIASRMLVAAGLGSLGVGLLHLVIVFVGPTAYRYFGAGEALVRLAEQGSPLPPLVTLGLAAAFAAFGLYGLSGAGWLRHMPLLRAGLVVVGALYTLRGLVVILQLQRLARAIGSMPAREVFFSLASLVIGLCYLAGLAGSWRTLGAPAAAGAGPARPA
jgi:hypothetical protein